MNKAMVIDRVARNVTPADQVHERFHPDIAALFVDVPADVGEGWIETEDGWTAPPPVAPDDAPVHLSADAYVVDVPTFKMRFSPQQLLSVRDSVDPIVRAFLTEVLDDPRTVNVNLALTFVQQAVGYLAQIELIGPDDVARILAPKMT